MDKEFNNYILIKTEFLGQNGSLKYNILERALEITMHGMIFNANHMSGIQLAHNILNVINHSECRYMVSWDKINEVRFYCCAGGFGGFFSIANILASRFNKPVRAYTTRYSPVGSRGGYSNNMALFSPRRHSVFCEGVHKVLFFTSENILLPIRRTFR